MNAHLAVLILFGACVGVAAALLIISRFLGPRRPLASKLTTYECGVEPRIKSNLEENQVPIKYATVALIFIIFDVETAFFIPWAVIFRDELRHGAVAGPIWFIGIFLFMLLLGLVYAYRRNVFQWD